MVNATIGKARVKRAHLADEFYSLLHDFVGKSATSNVFVGGTHFHHNLALGSFDNQIRKDRGAKVVKHGSLRSPSKNRAKVGFFRSPSIAVFSGASERLFKPLNNYFVATANHNASMELPSIPVFALFDASCIETSLSINQSRKICDLSDGVIGMVDLSKFSDSHISPYVKQSTIVNERKIKIQPERLNEKTRKGCDSLDSIEI